MLEGVDRVSHMGMPFEQLHPGMPYSDLKTDSLAIIDKC